MTIEIMHLTFSYTKSNHILENISLSIPQGEILGILGPNGTGKTTLLKCINNLLTPDSGTVFLDDVNIATLKPKEIAQSIAYVPQYTNPQTAITTIDTIMMGRLPYTNIRYSKKDKDIVFEIIQQMGLEKLAFRSLCEMSGGEKQRIFIARALAQEPKIILLDEPTSSLDLHNQIFIMHNISNLAKNKNLTVIMTIHDLNLAAMFCDKILVLKNSHIYSYGVPQEILTSDLINKIYDVNTKVTIEDGFKHIRLLRE